MDVLGIDMGGVITARVGNKSDTSFFGSNYLATPPTPHLFDALPRLVAERFNGRVVIISKAGDHTRDRCLDWLAHHDFYDRTGIAPGQINFCYQRADKAAIAAELGVTHFVDDLLEVLGAMPAVPHRYLFNPRPAEVARFERYLAEVIEVSSWQKLASILLSPRPSSYQSQRSWPGRHEPNRLAPSDGRRWP